MWGIQNHGLQWSRIDLFVVVHSRSAAYACQPIMGVSTHVPRDLDVHSLSQAGLGPLDDMRDRLQNALVIDSAESHTIGPAHFLKHGSALVCCSQLWRGGPHDLAIFVGEGGLVTSATTTRSSARLALVSGGPRLHVWAAKVLATRTREDLFEIDFAVLDSSQSAVQGRPSLIARTGGFALDIEFVGQFVDDFARVRIHGREEDAMIDSISQMIG